MKKSKAHDKAKGKALGSNKFGKKDNSKAGDTKAVDGKAPWWMRFKKGKK